MSLATKENLRDYVRLETNVELPLLDQLIDQAEALVRSLLDRPIENETRSGVIEDDRVRAAAVRRLFLPDYPLDVETLELTDRDETVLDLDTLRIDGATGIVRGVDAGCCFGAFPYGWSAKTGLAVLEDYTTTVEPALAAAILAYGAMLYWQRNPNAASESTIGTTVAYLGVSMPLRTMEVIRTYRRAPT